ncbi:acyl-CoA dehydrogenase family protein [Marinovum sp.]|uniref:acyl-CoA dehydrogenase family protein n=1 Tax=Marinovum sp. TaxID=2024839 RepID=UPI002B2730CF|nr:acyl-CoA dehydrogenase family protein [Marinovum sp.]
MKFVITEEQQMMTDMVQDFLSENCTPAQLRALADKSESHDPARWSALCDLGLPGAMLGEAAGGLGLSAQDVIGLVRASGAALLPEPLAETMGIALPALEALGAPASIPDILSGARRIAVAHPLAPLVEGADSADAILMFTDCAVRLIPSAGAELTPQPGIDPLRRLFTVAGTEGETLAEGDAATAATGRAGETGALFAAAQLLGIAQKAIDISVAYACERQQFGKPIGTYQALKHHLASAQVAVEFARPVLLAAAATAAHPADRAARARVSHAKFACGRAADQACRTAIQVHGGMGYSQEADVHLYLKRALALRQSWGSETFHRNRYADRLGALPLGPGTLFDLETT